MLHGVLTKLFARLSLFFFQSIHNLRIPSIIVASRAQTYKKCSHVLVYSSISKFRFFFIQQTCTYNWMSVFNYKGILYSFRLIQCVSWYIDSLLFCSYSMFRIILYCWSCDFSLLFVFPQNILTKKMNKKRTTKNNANFYFTSGHFIFEYLSVERFVSTFESHASKIRTKPTNNS